jgi:hypothetical protein
VRRVDISLTLIWRALFHTDTVRAPTAWPRGTTSNTTKHRL